jgi:hypothetical protein
MWTIHRAVPRPEDYLRTEAMTKWTMCGTGFALLVGGVSQLAAQVPSAPAAPGAAVPPLAAPAAAPPAAAPSNLWSFLLPSKDMKTACKEHICSTQIGQLLNNSLSPIGAFTGGLLGPCCPQYTQDDLKKPSDSAEGAAAKIKADEAGAKARVAAVKYLAHVDCSYWPEAADALVNALRADKNECVRFAAAQALGTGCCCGKKTIVALSIAAAGSDRDGNPAEKSDRVRMVAQSSLELCLARCGCAIPIPTSVPKEGPTEGPSPIKRIGATEMQDSKPVEPAAYYKRVESMTNAQLTETVRRSLLTWNEPSAQAVMDGDVNVAMAGGTSYAADHSLLGVFSGAFAPAKSLLAPPGRQMQPVHMETMKAAENVKPTDHVKVTENVKKTEKTKNTDKVKIADASEPAPIQPKPIQKVVYQTPKTADWQQQAQPQAVKTPYELPVVKPAQPPALPHAAATGTSTVQATGAAVVQPPALPRAAAGQTRFPPASGMDVANMLKLLRDSSHPEQRVWAASELGSVDGRGNPDVVDALVVAGQIDASAAVRTTCVRALVKMNASGPAVRQLFESLQSDADRGVQQEAMRALSKMK